MRVAALVFLVLVVAAPAAAASVTAKLVTTTQAPRVGEAWRYTVTVRKGARPVAARMRLQILLGQSVVGCWRDGRLAECLDGGAGDWIAFRGMRSGIVRWPAESVGVRLTFRATVQAGGETLRLRAPVTVRPAG